MTDWLTIDASGTTIRLPPVPEGVATALALVAAGIAFALVLALLNAWNRRAEHKPRLGRLWRSVRAALGAHYLWLILFFAVVLFLVVAGFFRIMAWPALSALSSTVLDPIAAGAEPDAEAVRAFVYGLAALTGALAILATIPFQLVRVWINERTAATGEQNLITDLINKAVAGLATEKSVSRIGRPVAFRPINAQDDSPPVETVIEWQGKPLPERDGLKASPGDWQTFETTEPNIEVRLGAIYALERISQDSDRDHVRIMEILCAYLRGNAPARDAPDHGLGDWPDRPEAMTVAEHATREKMLDERSASLAGWVNALPTPRADIQAAITVIGRRRPDRIALERPERPSGGAAAYRLDLRGVTLRRADLRMLDLEQALLSGARMEGANLVGANLVGVSMQEAKEKARLEMAILAEAHMMRADFRGVQLEGAVLFNAHMEGADLRNVHMERANLGGARMDGANLYEARMEGAGIGFAHMKGSDLRKAHMEEAILWMAHMDGADLREVRMEAAMLREAHMEEANLGGARMAVAILIGARMAGANLIGADLRFVNWAGAHLRLPAHFADFRGAQDLTQAQLDNLIGNEETLLPDGLSETGEPFHVWSCWVTPPPKLEAMLERAAFTDNTRATLRAQWLCGPDNPRRPTGTPLALDATRPPGHPLDRRD